MSFTVSRWNDKVNEVGSSAPTSSEEAVKAETVAEDPLATQKVEHEVKIEQEVKLQNPTESQETVKADEGQDPLQETTKVTESETVTTSAPASSSGSATVSAMGSLAGENPTASEEDVRADSSPVDPLETAQTSVQGRDPVEAQRRTVFVGSLSWSIDDDWLRDEMLKALGVSSGVNAARVARKPNGQSKGCASMHSICLSSEHAG